MKCSASLGPQGFQRLESSRPVRRQDARDQADDYRDALRKHNIDRRDMSRHRRDGQLNQRDDTQADYQTSETAKSREECGFPQEQL